MLGDGDSKMNGMWLRLSFMHFSNNEENILVPWCDDKARARGMRPEMRDRSSGVMEGEER